MEKGIFYVNLNVKGYDRISVRNSLSKLNERTLRNPTKQEYRDIAYMKMNKENIEVNIINKLIMVVKKHCSTWLSFNENISILIVSIEEGPQLP